MILNTPIFLLLLVTLLTGCGTHLPRAHQGVLDLRGYSFSDNAPIPLNGEWQIYWNQLIPASSFTPLTKLPGVEMTTVPAPWAKSRPGAVFGYATYHLTVLIDPTDISRLTLLCKEQPSAYALWINGVKTVSSGRVATQKSGEDPRFVTSFGTVTATDTLDLVLQISNFHIDAGGFTTPILLGSSARVTGWFSLMVLLQIVSLGIMIFVFLQYGSAWLHRSGEPANLYLALYSLLWAAAVFTESAEFRAVTLLFPNFPFELANKIYFIALGTSFPLTCLFCQRLFPSPLLKICNPLLSGLSLTYTIVIIFTSAAFYTRLFPLFITLSDLCIIAIAHALISAVRARRREALLFAVGFGAFSLAGLNDSLYNSAIIQSHFLCTYGAVTLLLVEAVLVSRRYAATSAANVRLLSELQIKTNEVQSLISRLSTTDTTPIQEISAQVSAMKEIFDSDDEPPYLLAVRLMQNCIALWQKMTGGQKADFAEQSGLWSVHPDKNGWRRTLTLDKYLDPEKIPVKPRWQSVFRSVDFILNHPAATAYPTETEALRLATQRLQRLILS